MREGASFVLCFSAQNAFHIRRGPTQGSLQIKSTKFSDSIETKAILAT